ncbi:UNVERIFIED_CONTAM: hypothetical protein HDU68_006932 [Siphonaria sp. JEL0065]|nr:hypothetical protein HDU68_006932 [Siphonaria sp. JEL0065]
MKLSAIISSIFLAVVAASAPIRRGAPAPTDQLLSRSTLMAWGVAYSIRTSVNTQLANFVSFSIDGSCNLDADDKDLQDDGTAAVPTIDAKGKAILIRWGDTAKGGSAKRCGYAYKAGAVACILYNNGVAPVNIAGAAEILSMFIPRDAGQAIVADIKAGKVPKVIVTFKSMMSPLSTAATLSSFSSPGLDNELNIKPDLGGVGGMVFSTMSPFAATSSGLHENYGVTPGTSMATPYVSGVAALILQARGTGKLTFPEFKALLQNTASLKPIYGAVLPTKAVKRLEERTTVDFWCGLVLTGDQENLTTLPAGPYKIVFKALRAFGKLDVEADYDVVSTETFNLVY